MSSVEERYLQQAGQAEPAEDDLRTLVVMSALQSHLTLRSHRSAAPTVIFTSLSPHFTICRAVTRWQELEGVGRPAPIFSFPWSLLYANLHCSPLVPTTVNTSFTQSYRALLQIIARIALQIRLRST